MTRKRSAINLSISEYEKAQLERLALKFDQTWGEKPNVSKLIKAIANNKLRIAINHDWSRDRINTLNYLLNWLKDEGEMDKAMIIAQLLLERSELNMPLRQEIQKWVEQPVPLWRTELDRCCKLQRPFRLTYQDAAGRIWSFTVRHAKIEPIEDRQYLNCWCDETEGNQDVEALQHNWCLRLDRIPEEVVISPVEGTWQPELSYIEVELHLSNRLAVAYRVKTGADIQNDWLPDQQVRRVVRRVHNTFWFFRQIQRYGSDCEIISPQEVRDRFAREVMAMYQQYFPKPDGGNAPTSLGS